MLARLEIQAEHGEQRGAVHAASHGTIQKCAEGIGLAELIDGAGVGLLDMQCQRLIKAEG